MSTDVDVSIPAALLGNPGRARLVLALVDGRALPASVLASEAGVAASTAGSTGGDRLTDTGKARLPAALGVDNGLAAEFEAIAL